METSRSKALTIGRKINLQLQTDRSLPCLTFPNHPYDLSIFETVCLSLIAHSVGRSVTSGTKSKGLHYRACIAQPRSGISSTDWMPQILIVLFTFYENCSLFCRSSIKVQFIALQVCCVVLLWVNEIFPLWYTKIVGFPLKAARDRWALPVASRKPAGKTKS